MSTVIWSVGRVRRTLRSHLRGIQNLKKYSVNSELPTYTQSCVCVTPWKNNQDFGSSRPQFYRFYNSLHKYLGFKNIIVTETRRIRILFTFVSSLDLNKQLIFNNYNNHYLKVLAQLCSQQSAGVPCLSLYPSVLTLTLSQVLPLVSGRAKEMGFPGGANGKEPACQCRRHKRPGFIPGARKIPWRRAQQLMPVFLPGESNGQRSLVSYSPWGRKELDTTEVTQHSTHRAKEMEDTSAL